MCEHEDATVRTVAVAALDDFCSLASYRDNPFSRCRFLSTTDCMKKTQFSHQSSAKHNTSSRLLDKAPSSSENVRKAGA